MQLMAKKGEGGWEVKRGWEREVRTQGVGAEMHALSWEGGGGKSVGARVRY